MKILMTAFDPFGGESVNPASEAVKSLPDTLDGAEIVKIIVPTAFKKSVKTAVEAIERENPDFVICVGQAGGSPRISVERVGINCMDASGGDNEGYIPNDEKIAETGPDAYFATLPIKEIVEAIKAEGIPAAVSNTAGTYVCNNLLYGVLHYIKERKLLTKAGFIHVPYIPAQVAAKNSGAPSMALDDIVKALTAAVNKLVQ